MILKVFFIFSVFDFVIVRFLLKRFSFSYFLGFEIYEIIVSKIFSNEIFLRSYSFLVIFFYLKLDWREMNRIKEEVGVYCF